MREEPENQACRRRDEARQHNDLPVRIVEVTRKEK